MNIFQLIIEHPVMEALGGALLHLIWQGAFVAGLLACVLFLLRNGQANLRYSATMAAMVLIFLLPIATAVQLYEPLSLGTGPQLLVPPDHVLVHEADEHVLHEEFVITYPHSSLQAARTPQSLSLWELIEYKMLSWRRIMIVFWLFGTTFCSLRLLTGFLTLKRLRRTASPIVDDRIVRLFASLQSRMNIKSFVELCASDKIQQPVLIGWLKPIVLLPASLLSGLTPAHLGAILAHELAHVRRHDYLVLLGQSVMETLFFYHPAVWWVSHRMTVEREYCCDEVAAEISETVVYAQALAQLEAGRLQLALGASDGRLVDRIRALSAREKSNGPIGGSSTTIFLVLAIGISTMLVSCKPKDDRPANIIFEEANEFARAGEYHAAEELAMIAAEKENLCAMELLAEMTYPQIGFWSPKKLVMLPPVKWSGQSERKSRKWSNVYVEALKSEAESGNVDAMLILAGLFFEGYSDNDWRAYIEKNQEESIRWVQTAVDQGSAQAHWLYPTIVGMEEDEERLRYYLTAIQGGEDRAFVAWHAAARKGRYDDPLIYFTTINEAFELDPVGAKRQFGKSLTTMKNEAEEGDQTAIDWLVVADSLNIYEKFAAIPEPEPRPFPRNPFCPETTHWRYAEAVSP